MDETVTADLAEAVLKLDARSQDILKSRWMTEDKATLHELAAKYSVSRNASARSKRTPSASSAASWQARHNRATSCRASPISE